MFSAFSVLGEEFVFFQLKFSPADIPHTSLRTMAKNVRRAMMPECEIYKIELAEGENDVFINYLMFCDYLNFLNYRNYLIQLFDYLMFCNYL